MSVVILPLHMRADKSPMFKLYTDADLAAMPQAAWIVKGVIPSRGVGAIYGPSRSGKSFLCIDLLAHIAHGARWFGCKVNTRPVVYIPFEGRGGIPRRVQAWQRAHGGSSTDIRFLMDGIDLRKSDHVDELVAQLLAAGAAGAIICIDTLAQAFAGLDENSSQMGAVIEAAEALSTGIGGVAMVVHHTGKDESAGMRGWSGLPAAMDFSIECKFVKSPGAHKDDREFVLAKVKDGEDGRAFRFRLATVMLGRDEDLEQITSLVVEPQAPVTHEEVRQEMAEQHAKTDDFVWTWIRDEVAEGQHPSGNSLNGQRAAKAPHLSQVQLREAIARLLAGNRLAPEGSGKKAWLRAMESSPATPT